MTNDVRNRGEYGGKKKECPYTRPVHCVNIFMDDDSALNSEIEFVENGLQCGNGPPKKTPTALFSARVRCSFSIRFE